MTMVELLRHVRTAFEAACAAEDAATASGDRALADVYDARAAALRDALNRLSEVVYEERAGRELAAGHGPMDFYYVYVRASQG